MVALAPPDDALLRAVLVKLFADRQLAVDEQLIGYVATRIGRSFADARAAVATLDEEAMRRKRPLTRALAAEVLRADRKLDRTVGRRAPYVMQAVTNDGDHDLAEHSHDHAIAHKLLLLLRKRREIPVALEAERVAAPPLVGEPGALHQP